MTEKTKAAGLDTRAAFQETLPLDYQLLAESTQADAIIHQRILETHPDLLNHGWRTPGGPTTPIEITSEIVRQVQLTIAYLATHKIGRTISSYSLKHCVERWGAQNKLEPYTYVQNSSAIVGALLSGYAPVLAKGAPYPNVWFERGARK